MKRKLGGRTKSNLPFDSLMSVPIRRVGKDLAVREKKGLLSKTRGGMPAINSPIDLKNILSDADTATATQSNPSGCTPGSGTAPKNPQPQRQSFQSRIRPRITLPRITLPRIRLSRMARRTKPSLQDIHENITMPSLPDIRKDILIIACNRGDDINVNESYGRLHKLMNTSNIFYSNESIAKIIFDSIASTTDPELGDVTPLQHVITTIQKGKSRTKTELFQRGYTEQFNHSYRQLLRDNYRNIILLFSLMMETNINARLLIFHIAYIIHYYCSKLDTWTTGRNSLYENRTCDILEDEDIQNVHFLINKSFTNLNDAGPGGPGAAGAGAAEPGAEGKTGTLRVEEYDNALTLVIDGFKLLHEYTDVKHLQQENINLIIEMLTNFTNKLLLYTNNSDIIKAAFETVYKLFKSNSSNIEIINIIKLFITNERIKTIIIRNCSEEIDFVEKTLNIV